MSTYDNIEHYIDVIRGSAQNISNDLIDINLSMSQQQKRFLNHLMEVMVKNEILFH